MKHLLDSHKKYMFVFGGGCYGTLHVKHLMEARKKGKIDFDHIVVIDRATHTRVHEEFPNNKNIMFVQDDWVNFGVETFMPSWINKDSEIVLPCIGPHLFFWWTFKRLSREGYDVHPCHVELLSNLPVQFSLEGGFLAVSYARWQCPPTCIEPEICPAIAQARTWELPDFLENTWKHGKLPCTGIKVFISKHRVWGVATVFLSEYFRHLSNLKKEILQHPHSTWYIATTSSCHGLIGCFRVSHTPER